jgi:hypothetical protein
VVTYLGIANVVMNASRLGPPALAANLPHVLKSAPWGFSFAFNALPWTWQEASSSPRLMAMCSFPSYVGTFPHAERLGLERKSLRKIKKTNKVTASL